MNPLTSQQSSDLLDSAPTGGTIYLVGAGGCGMSGLGHLLLDLGFRVAGSDVCANEETRQLTERGATIDVGHAAANVSNARPALVVYSSAVRRENLELVAAEQLRVPIARRAVVLAALLGRQRGVCVAGMHGKTTTTALLAFALEQLGARPSYAIGALVPQLERHARWAPPSDAARGKLFVIEADESDGTLREFHPEAAIVLNVDAEHLDYYADLDAACSEFQQFARQTRGPLIFCADDARLAALFAQHPGAISYGFHSLAEYRAASPSRTSFQPVAGASSPSLPRGQDALRDRLEARPTTTFEVWHAGTKLGDFTTQLLGEKNVSNACAVIALLHRFGFEAADIARAIAPFTGAARRQQELFADERFRIFDDYGHHPAEVQPTLRAFKGLGSRRLLVAFQPHRYTRTQHLLPQFATAFRDADRLWITEIYAASETPIPGVTGEGLADAIRAQGQAVEFVSSLDALRAAVRAAMLPGDIALFLGAGDITQAALALAGQLRKEPVATHETLFAELAAQLSPGATVKRDEPLAKRTTLRVGGKADLYVEPTSEDDLAGVLRLCAKHQTPFTMIGRGSNLLIRDGGIRGVVICLCHPNFSRLEINGEKLHCGAGVKLKAIAVEARRAGLTGLEFLEGIPGSLGGSMRMNAGAMGSWLFDVVERVRFMDHAGQVHERLASEVNVEYRGCPLFKNHIALGAVLKGQPTTAAAVAERMAKFSAKRWESQPAAPSAGCIFKNPATIPAGKLIDELDLKGTRVGGAVVSDVHGNFIVNEGHATARDVLNLIALIQQRVRSARGIELHTEVEILGEE